MEIDGAERRALHEQVTRVRASIGEVAACQIDVNPAWTDRLDEIAARIDQRPEVAVALLGGTGAGKSTLVNALAEKRILPVSSMRACTSAITEVVFGEGGYEVDVEFIDRESWRSELYQLEQDIADFRQGKDEGELELGIRKEAEDKLRTVYGESANQFFVSLDQRDLREPEEITEAFAAGHATFADADDAVFRTNLKKYLDSEHRFWPIVKRVRVRGPFDGLADGAVLVDLPGLNDPNAAREEATRQHLRSAQFVWVVFNMKRALTRDVFDYLREGDLLRQLFMDGRTGSLTLVGTASDDIDEDADIERLGLDEDASTVEIVRARADAVRAEVRRQLDELGQLMVRESNETGDGGRELLQQLVSAPIHCVSAKEYQKIIGVMQKRSQLLHHPADTGIPDLFEHLGSLVAELGVDAHRSRIDQDLAAVALDVQRAVATTRTATLAQQEATDAQLEEVRAAATRSRTFLVDRAERALEAMDAQVEAGTELLRERLGKVTVEAEQQIDDLSLIWRGMHWSTLRATARRGGRWTSRGRRIDMPAQISKPILDGISFAWVDFFGHRAVVALDSLERALTDAAGDFVDRFEVSCRSVPSLAALLEEAGDHSATTTRRLVAKHVGDLRREVQARLDSDRRELSERIVERVAETMAQAFEDAAAQRGTGTRDRMLTILQEAATDTADAMFAEVRVAVDALLVGLTEYISGRTRQLAQQVCSEADALARLVTETAADEFTQDIPAGVVEDLAALEARIGDLVAGQAPRVPARSERSIT